MLLYGKVDSDEFEISTPTLSSIKWWPGMVVVYYVSLGSSYMIISSQQLTGTSPEGGLGVVANHAMVIAQLVVNKKHIGLQNFIVPIRDSVTHEVLPGVEVGDIGPKVGTTRFCALWSKPP